MALSAVSLCSLLSVVGLVLLLPGVALAPELSSTSNTLVKDIISVTAYEGDEVTFSCPITGPNSTNNQYIKFWKVDEQCPDDHTNIGCGITNGKTLAQKFEKDGRFSVNLDDKYHNLTIGNVSHSDAGIYRCTGQWDYKVTCIYQLKILVSFPTLENVQNLSLSAGDNFSLSWQVTSIQHFQALYIDSRGTQFTISNGTDLGERFAGRTSIKFIETSGAFILTLANLNREDSGHYFGVEKISESLRITNADSLNVQDVQKQAEEHSNSGLHGALAVNISTLENVVNQSLSAGDNFSLPWQVTFIQHFQVFFIDSRGTQFTIWNGEDQGERFAGRASIKFNETSGAFTLMLTNLNREDSGHYFGVEKINGNMKKTNAVFLNVQDVQKQAEEHSNSVLVGVIVALAVVAVVSVTLNVIQARERSMQLKRNNRGSRSVEERRTEETGDEGLLLPTPTIPNLGNNSVGGFTEPTVSPESPLLLEEDQSVAVQINQVNIQQYDKEMPMPSEVDVSDIVIEAVDDSI